VRVDRLILAFLLCLLPGAFWPGSTSYEAAKFLVLTVVFGALMLNGARRIGSGRDLLLPTVGESGIYFGLLLVILMSGSRGANTSLVLRTWLLVASWALILWLVCSRTHEVSHLRGLLQAMTAGAVLTSSYGLAQIHGLVAGPDPALGVPPGISTFGNENQMAGLAAVVLWPALSLVFLSRNRAETTVTAAAVIVLLAAVVQAEAAGPRLAVCGAALVVVPGWIALRAGRIAIVPWLGLGIAGLGAVATIVVFVRILEPRAAAELPLPDFINRWLADNNGDIRRR